MKTSKILPVGLMFLMTAGTLVPTFAGSVSGRRNTTIGLGAATLYHALKRHPGEAIAFGVGTGVAYSRYEKARRAQARRRNYAASYGNGGTVVRTSSARYAPSGASSASSGAAAHKRIDSLKAQTVGQQAVVQRQIDQLAFETQELAAQNRRLVNQVGALQSENVRAQGLSTEAQDQSARYRMWALIATLIAIPSLGGFAYMLFKNRGNPQFRRLMQT